MPEQVDNTQSGQPYMKSVSAPMLSSQRQDGAAAATLRSLAFLQTTVQKCQAGTRVQLCTHGSLSFPQFSDPAGKLQSYSAMPNMQMATCMACSKELYVMLSMDTPHGQQDPLLSTSVWGTQQPPAMALLISSEQTSPMHCAT